MKKILVSAYACLPNAGSEPGLGWNWVIRLASKYEVWLLTEEYESARVLREYIPIHHKEFADSLHIIGIPRIRFGENASRHFFYYLTYYIWQRKAYSIARELHSAHQFDLVHQLNMIGYREPGFLWKLDSKFIWGPVGGLCNFPLAYFSELSWKARWEVLVKNLLNAVQKRIAIRPRLAGRKAALILAANSDVRRELEEYFGFKSELRNETGARPSNDSTIIKTTVQNPIRVVWCGVNLPRKMLPLALRTIAQVYKQIDVRFDIIGPNTDDPESVAMAESLGIESICCWHGVLPHAQVQHALSNADLLLFTSLIEGTPHIVLEALSLGRPVVCHKISGHGEIVDESCGAAIPVNTPETSVRRLCDAIVKFGSQPQLLQEASRGALRKANSVSWDAVLDDVLSMYTTLLADQTPRTQAKTNLK